MAKRPSSRWNGSLVFSDLNLKIPVKFFSGERRYGPPLDVIQVHRECKTTLPKKKKAEDEAEDAAAKEDAELETESPVQTTRQVHCPACNRALRPEEIGAALDIPNVGIVLLDESDLASLKPSKVKEVEVQLRRDPSQALAAIGMGRRLYIMPYPESVSDYFTLMKVFRQAGVVGLISEIMIGQKPYVLLIRVIETPAAVFGNSTTVLVADEFFDTEKLIDPRELELLPAEVPDLSQKKVAQLVKLASQFQQPIDLNECINPLRRRREDLVRRKAVPVRTPRPL